MAIRESNFTKYDELVEAGFSKVDIQTDMIRWFSSDEIDEYLEDFARLRDYEFGKGFEEES